MKTIRHIACLSVALLALTGCATTPPRTGEKNLTYASDVGDQTQAAFGEVVVSLRLRGSDAPYHNLHVAVTAFVNAVDPRDAASAYAAPSTSGAQSIVQRCEARVTARLVEVLTGLGEQSLEDMPRLRTLVRTEAQAVLDDVMKSWKRGPDYRAEIAVTRLHWTPASVGPSSVPRGRLPW